MYAKARGQQTQLPWLPPTAQPAPPHRSAQTLAAPCAPVLWLLYRSTGLMCKKKFICRAWLGANAMGLSPIQSLSPSQVRTSIDLLPDLELSVARDVSSPQCNYQPSQEISRESNQSRNERTKIHYKRMTSRCRRKPRLSQVLPPIKNKLAPHESGSRIRRSTALQIRHP